MRTRLSRMFCVFKNHLNLKKVPRRGFEPVSSSSQSNSYTTELHISLKSKINIYILIIDKRYIPAVPQCKTYEDYRIIHKERSVQGQINHTIQYNTICKHNSKHVFVNRDTIKTACVQHKRHFYFTSYS